jgi:hypothetical protein
MADQVLKGGLILTDWADNMAKVDAARFANIQRQQQQEEYAKSQAVETAANAARQQYAAGNFDGARQTAAGGNAWDVWQSIDTNQRAQIASQATDIGTAAYNLARLPKGQQRLDYFASFAPTLKSHGMSDEEIQQYTHSGFLDNDDALHGYADKALGISNLWKADQEREKAAYDRETDLMKPITAADGAVLTRNETGSYAPIYTPGSKPMQEIIKNEDGSSSYVNIPGTAGTSYTPGGDTSRVMNYEARGAGVAAVPDSVQTLGQFSDFASGLNRQGIKSSAAGTYQIVGDTMRRYAPKVLGNDWRNQPFNQQSQERVAEAIFNDNRGSAAALRSQWVSLSPADAERVRNMPWSQARQFIAAGESGSSAPQGAGPRPAGNGIQTVNLGGGRTGPLWKDETRQIGGQNVVGQRNQQTGEFKPLGGAAAKASKAVDYDGQISNADNSLATIDRALRHPGLNAAFGMPSLNPLDGNLFGKIIPGSPAADALALVDTVKSQAFLAGVSQMKGQGALSDAEGAKISTAIANLSGNQSDAQIREDLGVIRNMVATGRNRMVQQRNRGGGQQQGQAETRTVNGRTYVKVQGGWKAQ